MKKAFNLKSRGRHTHAILEALKFTLIECYQVMKTGSPEEGYHSMYALTVICKKLECELQDACINANSDDMAIVNEHKDYARDKAERLIKHFEEMINE